MLISSTMESRQHWAESARTCAPASWVDGGFKAYEPVDGVLQELADKVDRRVFASRSDPNFRRTLELRTSLTPLESSHPIGTRWEILHE